MKIFRSRPAAAIALAAALSLTATPVMARGYGGGWGHHRDRDHVSTGEAFAGLLVLGGIIAIASAASSKNKESREADYRYPDQRAGENGYPGGPYPNGDARPEWRSDDTVEHVPSARSGDNPARDTSYAGDRNYSASDRNIDSAVDACVAEVERGNRHADSVDAVNRSADGWTVEGRAGDSDFTCSVGTDGRIRGGIDYGS